jgi:ABC-type lipoprotein release transport system permease subunit
MIQEFKYAVRGLRRAPGFSAVIIVTLALAIGATTTIYSVVNGVLLRPLRFIVAIAIVLGVALTASLLPAQSAASVDPMEALRQD